MATETTTTTETTTLAEFKIIKEVSGDTSATHDFTVFENGTLDIMDNYSRYHGHENDPKEFVCLDIPSMRVLYALLSESAVQAMLAEPANAYPSPATIHAKHTCQIIAGVFFMLIV